MALQQQINIAPPPDEYNSRGRGVLAQPAATMRNTSASNVTELRWKAAQWRKHVAKSAPDDFLELMQRAAAELETEADRLEGRSQVGGIWNCWRRERY